MINLKYSKERIKQILLTFVAFSLIFFGYMNYNVDKDNNIEVSAETNDINIGDVQLVNSEPTNNEGAIVSNDDLEEKTEEIAVNYDTNEVLNNNEMENVSISTSKQDYFEETKIERNRMYSEMIETYQKIIDNQETPSEQKAIAVQEISNITNIKNGIMISENLIKNKGFENVVILCNNEKINVVVKSSNLNQEQISKIQNIIERELNAKISNINITNRK